MIFEYSHIQMEAPKRCEKCEALTHKLQLLKKEWKEYRCKKNMQLQESEDQRKRLSSEVIMLREELARVNQRKESLERQEKWEVEEEDSMASDDWQEQLIADMDQKVEQSAIDCFKFEVRLNAYSHYFKKEGKIIKYAPFKENVMELRQVVSQASFSRQHPQTVAFKVLQCTSSSMYFGLCKRRQCDESHSVRASKGGNIVSYATRGGQNLFCQSANWNVKVPPITDGDIVAFTVEYKGGKVNWRVNEREVVTTDVEFGGVDWHAFVTMKVLGDSIELM